MKLQTPKGFRDFLPVEARKRKFVVDKIVEVFERFGFDPLETPTLEFAQTLKGKYGEDEKLIYEFETKGGDKVALRYDQTVPVSRVAAQYPNLPKPFKRYQIQSAYRGENTQKGRYREFLQCDADIIGISSPLADAEILALVYEIYQNLKLDVLIKVNDRTLLQGIEPKYLSAVDKLLKIGEEGVLKELQQKGMDQEQARQTLDKVRNLQTSDNLKEVIKLFEQMGYPKECIQFDPTLIRGLDYYTGLIVEVVLKSAPLSSSLLGGGRYDKLIGLFTGQDQPATGFAVGFDRTVEAMEEANILDAALTNTKVLVTVFNDSLIKPSLEVAARLRKADIPTEVWLDGNAKLDKQLKYANQKSIPYVVIIGPDEIKKEQVTLKNLVNRAQETCSLEQLLQKLA